MRRIVMLASLLLLCGLNSNAQIIHTIAGGGPGSGIPALSANLNSPLRLIVDAGGNYYVVGYGQHRVFKVDTAGNLTVVAGTGIAGFSGDGGLATNATLNAPIGICLDASGNLFIADQGNNRVRKVSTSGNITTVAGNGASGYGGDGGLATSTSLNLPYAVYADASGNLFIADTYNQRIRKVNPAGIISTFAGTGAAGFNGDGIAATTAALQYPEDVLMDGSGNLLIADVNNRRIRKVNTSGTISTIAGNGVTGFSGDGGAATAAALSFPSGIAMDGLGNLYIADTNNNRIRKVNTSGIITTVAGTGAAGYNGSGIAATAASLYNPWGVAADNVGQIYIPDRYNYRVRKVDTTGKIFDVAGNGSPSFGGDGGLATGASLNNAIGVTVDGSGNIYIADVSNYRIRKVDTTGKISTVVGTGISGFSGDGGLATNAMIGYVYRMAVDGAGNLYFADYGNNRVRKVDTSGHISTIAGSGCSAISGDGGLATSSCLAAPFALALDGAGNVYFSEFGSYRVRKVSAGGILSTVAGSGVYGFSGDGGPATAANMTYTYDIARDSAGNFYLADGYNFRIRKVNTSGIITTVAGNGANGFGGDGGLATNASMTYTVSVAVDGTGNLFIGDLYDYRVRKVDSAGKISTFAGNGTYAFSGDGGPATSASITYPYGVYVDAAGNLLIADYTNSRIRKVDAVAPAAVVTLSAASLNFGHSQLGTQTVAQSVTVTNSGNAALHVTNVSTSGDYAESDDCTPGPIAPTAHCTIQMSFLPTALGTRTGTVTITDDAGSSPQSVSLTGVGDPAATKLNISAPSVAYPANGTVTVTVTSSDGTVAGNVSLSVDGGTSITQALASGSSIFTFTSPTAGDHSLSANYTAQGNFAAGSATGTLHVDKGTQTITFAAPSSPANYNTSFDVAPTSSSGLSVSVGVTGVCSISAATVTMTSGTGTCILTASQAGDSNYAAATNVMQTVTAQKIDQAITFTGAPATAAFNTPFGVTATATSGLAVTLGASGACSISGTTVTMNSGTGTCSLTADQVGDANYSAAPEATQSTGALKAAATVTLSNLTQTYTGSALSPTVSTAPANLTINMTGAPDSSAGNYPVTATVNDPNYQGSANDTFVINRATPTVTWTNPANITYGTPLGSGQLTASTGVAGSFSYTPAAGTVLNAGSGQTLSVTFTPSDTTNYNSVSKSLTINVNPAPLTITANNASKVLDGPSPAFSATYNGLLLGQSPLSPGVLSGTLSCTSTATTTSPVGAYPITCSGQTSSNYTIQYVTGSLKVLYAQVGTACYGDLNHSILQPVNLDGTSVFKQKSTVPAKFRVCDANGVSVGTPGVVSAFNLVQIVSGTVVQTVTEAVDSTIPDASFRWDATGQQWIFNISSKNMSANVTYVFQITLNDGTTIPFQFGLK